MDDEQEPEFARPSAPVNLDQRRFPTGERLERVALLSRGRNARSKLKIPELRANLGDCLNTFLFVLSRTGRVVDAINAINADERAVYMYKDEDEEFRDCWREALALYTAALEDEVQRRAVEGVERAIMYKGAHVATERQYSDTLLIALLRRHSHEWREALSSPGASTSINVQTAQIAGGAPQELPSPETMRQRLAALSPAERIVALKLFGMDDASPSAVLESPSEPPPADPTPEK